MYVYWLKIIKYYYKYLDIDKEHYVLKLERCLDKILWPYRHQNPSLSFLFFFSIFSFSYLFSLFCFVFVFVFFLFFSSFFSFFNWKEKLPFRAWRGSEIHRSNSRCSTICRLDGHALNRPFHVFFLPTVFP